MSGRKRKFPSTTGNHEDRVELSEACEQRDGHRDHAQDDPNQSESGNSGDHRDRREAHREHEANEANGEEGNGDGDGDGDGVDDRDGDVRHQPDGAAHHDLPQPNEAERHDLPQPNGDNDINHNVVDSLPSIDDEEDVHHDEELVEIPSQNSEDGEMDPVDGQDENDNGKLNNNFIKFFCFIF